MVRYGSKRFLLYASLAAFTCMLHTTAQLPAEDDKPVGGKANVFVYPHKLTSKDKLIDGPQAKPIEIKSETTLIWVDLAPDARFAHPTEYILISADGTRVVKGSWWPKLNGKDLFRDGKAFKIQFPIKMPLR